MKREFMKGFTMLVLVVTLALTLAVVSANGQSTANRIVANVPFEFSVGYKALPAGAYSVQSIVSCEGVLIQSADGKTSALRLTDATRQIKDKPKARLVFHRYGERYFLAEVWNGVDNTGRQLTKSQEERAIANELMLASTKENAHAPNATYEIVEVLALLR